MVFDVRDGNRRYQAAATARRPDSPPGASSSPSRCARACWPRPRPRVCAAYWRAAWRSRDPRPACREDRGGSIHQQAAQIAIAAFADRAELHLAAGPLLPGHQAERGGKVPPAVEMSGSVTIAASAEARIGPKPGMVFRRRIPCCSRTSADAGLKASICRPGRSRPPSCRSARPRARQARRPRDRRRGQFAHMPRAIGDHKAKLRHQTAKVVIMVRCFSSRSRTL